MNKFKILTILFISLFAFNVSALVDQYGAHYNPSTINIDYSEHGFKVYDGETQLSDYSEYVDFNNGTITLKKDINKINIDYIDFTITTNNNEISINDFILNGSEDYDYKGTFINSNIVFERGYIVYSEHSFKTTFDLDYYYISIIDSSIKTNSNNFSFYSRNMIDVLRSDIDVNTIGHVASIKDSNIRLYEIMNELLLDNTTLVADKFDGGSLYITNNSNVQVFSGGSVRHLILDNSTFLYKYKYNEEYEEYDDYANYDEYAEQLARYRMINVYGRFAIHNSIFEIDASECPNLDHNMLEFDYDNYEFDDHMMFTDSSGNVLKIKTWKVTGGNCASAPNPNYLDNDYTDHSCAPEWTSAAFVSQNDEPVKNMSITSIVEVRLKVRGTWADGTTDDIVIYKPAFSKISFTDIPVGKMTLEDFENGDWDTKPVNAVLEENKDVVLTLTISSVKGIEENPKTGLFNDILLFIPVIISILGFNYLKKLELFKKM
jgi:hypothetical protein